MRHQRDGNVRNFFFLPSVHESYLTSLTIQLDVTAGDCAAPLVEERAVVRVGTSCGPKRGCVGGGSFLDDFCAPPEFAFKLAICDTVGKRGNRRIPGGLWPLLYKDLHACPATLCPATLLLAGKRRGSRAWERWGLDCSQLIQCESSSAKTTVLMATPQLEYSFPRECL